MGTVPTQIVSEYFKNKMVLALPYQYVDKAVDCIPHFITGKVGINGLCIYYCPYFCLKHRL